jgi:broad specificity phosphatase PhoE
MYLMRHGATEVNIANPPRLQGRGMNLPLSAIGIAQSETTARFLADKSLTAVFSSPLLRAQHTARYLAEPHGLDVQTVQELIEVDVGRWENRSWVEISQTQPEAYRRFMEDPGTHGYDGGESFQHVQERVVPALARVMEQNASGRIAVVAHNIVNRCYLAALLTLPIAVSRMIHQDNCGLNVVHCTSGRMLLQTMNSTFHLEILARCASEGGTR